MIFLRLAWVVHIHVKKSFSQFSLLSFPPFLFRATRVHMRIGAFNIADSMSTTNSFGPTSLLASGFILRDHQHYRFISCSSQIQDVKRLKNYEITLLRVSIWRLAMLDEVRQIVSLTQNKQKRKI